jgi:hypothetical protein
MAQAILTISDVIDTRISLEGEWICHIHNI